ncbi:MAG: proton-conducting transporter membrane subunit, partial [Bdellovibrionota bacterium]
LILFLEKYSEILNPILIHLVWAAPIAVGAGIASSSYLFGLRLSEKKIIWFVMAAALGQLTGVIGLLFRFLIFGPQVFRFNDWFSLPHYQFRVVYVIDGISGPLLLLTAVIGLLIIKFSRTYLHRDEGFLRFFVMTSCTLGGMGLVLMAGTLDMLIAGWELVGLSSALLIAFFHRRKTPVTNALGAFATYRICDVGLIAAAVITHHGVTSAEINHLQELSYSEMVWVGFALLIAAAGKSALWPASGWFPRAMEGPTPSSALFYGGLSVHAGSYLLLRASSLYELLPSLRIVVISIGVLTAFHGWASHRVQADAKNKLALATMTQVGVLTSVIGLGWPSLAVALICGHTGLRIYQFLRTPNLLHDEHLVHSAVGEHKNLNKQSDRFSRFNRILYNYGFAFGYLNEVMERMVVKPVTNWSKWADALEVKAAFRIGSSVKKI